MANNDERQKLIQQAAKDAAKTIFAELVPSGAEETFEGTLKFSVRIKRGVPHEKSNPQKVRPWSLVLLLVEKLNGVTVDAVSEEWLAGLLNEARALDEERSEGAEKRVQALCAKLYPALKETRPGNVTTPFVHGELVVPEAEGEKEVAA